MSVWRISLFALLVAAVAIPAAPFLLVGLHIALIAAGTYDDEAAFAVPNRSETVAIRRRPIWSPLLTNEFTRMVIVTQNDRELFRSSIDLDSGGYSMVQVYQANEATLLLIDGLSCTNVDLLNKRVNKTNEAVDREKLRFIGAFDDYERWHGDETSSEWHTYRFIPASERGLRPFISVPDCFKPTRLTRDTYEVSSYFLDREYVRATLDRAASNACTWGFGYKKLTENRLLTDRGEIWRWQIQCQCVSVSCR